MNTLRTFAQLDYGPLVGDANRLPAMVKLTSPGHRETVAPERDAFTRQLDMLKHRWLRM